MITTTGIEINNRVYRNLESQVAYNAQEIEKLKSAAGATSNLFTFSPSDWAYSTTSFKYTARKPINTPGPDFIPLLIQTNKPYFKESAPATLPSFFILTEDGTTYLELSKYAPAPDDTYTFTLIAIPSTTATPFTPIDITPYPPKSGLTYYDTVEFIKENWNVLSSTSYFNFTKYYELYEDTDGKGYIIHFIPATHQTAQYIAQYRLYTDMIVSDEEFYINSPNGNPNVDLVFNIYLEPTSTTTSYYQLY